MRQTPIRLAGALIFAAALTIGVAAAQTPAGAPAPMAISQVKPGFYMITGAGGNAELRVGTDGLIVIDTKNAGQKNFDDLMALIRTVSDKPVKYVIDTHVHGDHTGNNDKFIAAGVPVIAQENLPGEIDAMATPASGVKRAKPTQTYRDKMDIAVGGAKATLYHFAPGHTGSDTLVYFPDMKVLVMGDELIAGSKNFDVNFADGGSVVGLIQSLDAALKLDFDTAIAGHGDAPMTKADVADRRRRFAALLEHIRAAKKAGVPMDQMTSIKIDDLGFAWNPTQYGPGSPRIPILWKEAGGS